ncbi:type II secretion system F family protein [Streptomyces sp. C8S0]|uniref:type II secretion system F family protein n=1 Tax=Streptomyces sp. C8S0 TaxID=2585716 RepID=UPI00299F5D66|nr:type II secretion system F family protein [Streptomyces sp. C8S0]
MAGGGRADDGRHAHPSRAVGPRPAGRTAYGADGGPGHVDRDGSRHPLRGGRPGADRPGHRRHRPAPLERELAGLAASVRAGRPLPDALRAFAEDVDDPLADVVVAALVMAAEQQGSQLGPLLGELADSVREQVAMRQRIDAGRASVRTGVRVTVTVTLGMAVGLVVLNRPYLDPFNTFTGQIVLGLVGALFAASFTYLSVIGRIDEPVRLMSPGVGRPATFHGSGGAR